MKLIGDFVAGLTDALGIKKKCGGCEKRRQAMNAADQRVRDALQGKGKKR